MKKFSYHIIICILSLAISSAEARVIANLYQVQVPVSSQGSMERDQAANTAFQQVLIKISGNSQVASNANIIPLLANANNYVEQYSYVQKPLYGNASSTASGNLALQFVFDSEQIKELLKSADQPIWGRDRPLGLSWIVLDNGQAQQLLSASFTDPTVLMLQQLMTQRGLPMIMPTIDSSGALSLTAADVVQINMTNIEKASTVYKPNFIVVAHITQANNQWNGQWVLLINGAQQTWQSSAPDEFTMLQQGVNSVADAVAQRYAAQSGAQKSQTTITITNLTTLAAYAKAKSYLKQLIPVQTVEVLQVSPNAIQFQLTYDGSTDDLMATIKLDAKLAAVDSANDIFKSNITYQWQ